jgi:hypothetical protein
MTNQADDLEAIRQTLAAYNVAGDRLKLEEMANLFLPDGVLESPTARMEGRAAIVAGLGGGGAAPNPGPRPTFVRHHLTTQSLELTGPDTAQGRSYFMVFTDIGLDHIGYYVDKLRKTDGRWLIEQRQARIDWMADGTLFGRQKEAYLAGKVARRS